MVQVNICYHTWECLMSTALSWGKFQVQLLLHNFGLKWISFFTWSIIIVPNNLMKCQCKIIQLAQTNIPTSLHENAANYNPFCATKSQWEFSNGLWRFSMTSFEISLTVMIKMNTFYFIEIAKIFYSCTLRCLIFSRKFSHHNKISL